MTVLFNEEVLVRIEVIQDGQPGNVTLSISTDSKEEDALRAVEFIKKFIPGCRKVKSRRTPNGSRIYKIIF